MKLKSILTTLLFALCSLGAAAQATYADALNRFFTLRGTSLYASMGQMSDALLLVTEALMEQEPDDMPEGLTAQEIVNEYTEKRLMNDFVAILIPYFAEKMTIADINKISDLYDTKKGQTATEHDAAFSQKADITKDLEIFFEQAGYDIASDRTPRPIKANASKKRQKLFHRYYVESELNKLFDAYIDSLVDTELDEVNEERIDIYRKFVADYMETALLNMSEKFYTDSDLKFFINLMSTPEYKRSAEVLAEVIGNPQKLGMALVLKYAEWLEGHE